MLDRNDVAAARRSAHPEHVVAIRRAGELDDPAVKRLARLDSTIPLRGDVLVAYVDWEPWAAISLTDGRVVADPFRPSAHAVELLRMRAEHLGRAQAGLRLPARGLRFAQR